MTRRGAPSESTWHRQELIFCGFYLFLKFYLFINFFGCIGASLLPWLSLVAASRGLLFVAVCGLLIAVASLVAGHGL